MQISEMIQRIVRMRFSNLKSAPMKRLLWFEKKGKLSRRYIELVEITKQVNNVGYRLVLPPKSSVVHNIFYVLILKKKNVPDMSHMMLNDLIQVHEDLSYEGE